MLENFWMGNVKCVLLLLSHTHNTYKARVYLNRSEIWSSFKRELLKLKCVGNTTRQLTPFPPPPTKKKRAQVGTGLLIWCPSTNFSLQISIFQIHRIFNISLSFLFIIFPFPDGFDVAWNVTEVLADQILADIGKRRQNRLQVKPCLN